MEPQQASQLQRQTSMRGLASRQKPLQPDAVKAEDKAPHRDTCTSTTRCPTETQAQTQNGQRCRPCTADVSLSTQWLCKKRRGEIKALTVQDSARQERQEQGKDLILQKYALQQATSQITLSCSAEVAPMMVLVT